METDLLIAAATVEVFDDLSVELLLHGSVETFCVLNRHRECVLGLQAVRCFAARFANVLSDGRTLEHILKQVLLGRWPQDILEPVKEESDELLGVTLDANISWVAFEILVCKAEVERISGTTV